jgi:hypothetical protein
MVIPTGGVGVVLESSEVQPASEYHFNTAPVVEFVALSVVELPWQIVEGVAAALVGCKGIAVTVTGTLTGVLLHVPFSART